MSEILIKGMEMPTSCRSCRFAGFGGRRCELNVCIFTGESQPTLSQERMSACPLVPVQPHGRLIDADALIAAENQHYALIEDEWYVTVRKVEHMPTIIPAEEGER